VGVVVVLVVVGVKGRMKADRVLLLPPPHAIDCRSIGLADGDVNRANRIMEVTMKENGGYRREGGRRSDEWLDGVLSERNNAEPAPRRRLQPTPAEKNEENMVVGRVIRWWSEHRR